MGILFVYSSSLHLCTDVSLISIFSLCFISGQKRSKVKVRRHPESWWNSWSLVCCPAPSRCPADGTGHHGPAQILRATAAW